ncbi:hypothetical protein BOTBODRAFT_46017 [Botryobasidium botryosum FD-172 SS1]|uniref:Apple domain-containing protein n=1 Tax=Botryobasidium botryosum (strain FD-172 SS1) TaxID=930990 RepID=A0A067MBT8_BOTB1|nr:hypothetical protein BOTBODRAFT_46017 [Botryobasidium botryosum FD-172 SS1]
MLFSNLFLATSALLVGFAAQATALTLPEHAARGDYVPTHDIAAARSSIDSRVNNCANLQGCSNCVANAACGFSKTAFTCLTRSGAANANQVTSNTGCPQMNQMQANGKTGKTVWESANYSVLDIKNVCAVTIALGDKAGKKEGAFVVQTPFGQPACIHHFSKGTGSCFPLGTANPTAKLGAPCDVAGEDNDD